MHVYIYPTAIGDEIRSAGGGGGGTLTGTVFRRQTRDEAGSKGADTGDFWGKQPAMCAGEPVSEGDFAVVFWARWEEPCPEIHLPRPRQRLIGLEFFSLSSALACNQQSQRQEAWVRDQYNMQTMKCGLPSA